MVGTQLSQTPSYEWEQSMDAIGGLDEGYERVAKSASLPINTAKQMIPEEMPAALG
jgi:hypothetical protein